MRKRSGKTVGKLLALALALILTLQPLSQAFVYADEDYAAEEEQAYEVTEEPEAVPEADAAYDGAEEGGSDTEEPAAEEPEEVPEEPAVVPEEPAAEDPVTEEPAAEEPAAEEPAAEEPAAEEPAAEDPQNEEPGPADDESGEQTPADQEPASEPETPSEDPSDKTDDAEETPAAPADDEKDQKDTEEEKPGTDGTKPEAAADPYKNMKTVREITEASPSEVFSTIRTLDKDAVAKLGDRGWAANIYYVWQTDSHNVVKKEDFSLKYQLEFSSAKAMPAKAVEIRVPLSLIKYLVQDVPSEVGPSKVGVPQASLAEPKKSETSFFNYYIDPDKKELVFFNYTEIPAGTVSAWQVLYSDLDVSKAVPDSKWSFVPEISVKNGAAVEHLKEKELLPVTGTVEYVKTDEEALEVETEEDKEDTRKPLDLTGLLTLGELTALGDDVAEATMMDDGYVDEDGKVRVRRAYATGTSHSTYWDYDIYYVNQSNNHEVWKYDDFSIKYQMEFHNSKDLEPFSVIIRIPRSLVKYGHGKEIRREVDPSDLGTPLGGYDPETGEYKVVKARKTAFNYYIDEETDELVFYNYKKLDAASGNAFQVLYTGYDVMEIEDQFEWSVMPDVKVKVETEEGTYVTQTLDEGEVQPLKGHVDTYTQLNNVTKRAYNGGASYAPGLYTKKQLQAFAPGAATKTIPSFKDDEGNEMFDYAGEKLMDHFDDYVYVVWAVSMNGYANQPYNIYFNDLTGYRDGPGGFIVGWTRTDSRYTTGGTAYKPMDMSGYYPEEAPSRDTFQTTNYGKNRNIEQYYFVVTAYPRDTVIPNETVLVNQVNVCLMPYDTIADFDDPTRTMAGLDEPKKDSLQYRSANANWTYVDYDWHYRGDIIGVRKDGAPDDLYSWVTVYNLVDDDTDLKTSDFTVHGTCRSFKLTHYLLSGPDWKMGDYIPGTYAKVSTVDDVVYAFPMDGSQVGNHYILSKDDYYFNRVTARINTVGYDVYEDETGATVPVSLTGDLDRGMKVYAMFALDESGNPVSADEWELAGYVEWKPSGNLTYTFTADQIAREPWRVKIEQNSVDYSTESYISMNISIRGDSPVFAQFPDASTIRVENLGGIMGEYFTPNGSQGYFQDTSTGNGNYSEPGLADLTRNLYGTILMRDNHIITLYSERQHAMARKDGNAYNDRVHGRANVRYRMEAFEGYQLYAEEAVNYIKEAGVDTPDRTDVVFYDLLPYGVQLDPSGTITAGRLKKTFTRDKTSKISENSWDKNQVTVTVDPETDVILNWNGTGRTMVAFHIHYAGRESSLYSGGEWFSGFGVAFDAYCEYEDYSLATERPNVVAYMPAPEDEKGILGAEGEVSYDDGNVVTTDGFKEYYQEIGADINRDGRTDTRNVLYAQSQVFSDIALASYDFLEKLVRADADPFGTYKASTTVLPGKGYEYQITLTNSSPHDLADIVFFDHIENALTERGTGGDDVPAPEWGFDDTCWYGTFDGVITGEVEALGAKPVIYYNAARDAKLPVGAQDPHEVLTEENGWIVSTDWTGDLADVKSVAFDLGANGFALEPEQSASVSIHMIAPDEMPEDSVWAYNNAAYYAYNTGTDTKFTASGNSVRVKMVEARKLELEKELTEDVPAERRNDEFKFFLTWLEDGEPYAEKEYYLYNKNEDGEWILQSGLHATDADGSLFLKEGQKAVFEGIDAENIKIEEEQSLRWTLEDDPELEGVITDGARTVLATNYFHPMFYVQKTVAGYPKDKIDEINETGFKFRLTREDGSPVANKEFYVTTRANTNGGEPVIINAIHKLYGNLTKPETLPEGTRSLTTDDDGVFILYPAETVVFPAERPGVKYTVTELEESYSIQTDWICEKPSVTTTVPAKGALATIANLWRYKNLKITKTMQDPAGTHDFSEEEFTFKVYKANSDDPADKGPQVTDFKWQLLDSYSAVPDEEAWQDPAEDGSVTAACAGKVIVLHEFKIEEEFIVEEILTDEQTACMEATEDSIYVQIPRYAEAGRVDFVNNWLLRDLKVSKDLITGDPEQDISAITFTMILETAAADAEDTAFVPAAEKDYTVYQNKTDEEIMSGTTASDGSFLIYADSYAVFRDLEKEGVRWRVRELADEEYPPITPEADPENEEMTLPLQGTMGDGQEPAFVNGKDGILVIKKDWIADDETSQRLFDAYGYPNGQYYGNTSLNAPYVYVNYGGIPVEIVTSKDVTYYTTTSNFSWKHRDPETGEMIEESVRHTYPYEFFFRNDDAYVVLRLATQFEGDPQYDFRDMEFRMEEQNVQRSFVGSGEFNGVNFVMNPGKNWEDFVVESTPDETPVVTFENHLASYACALQKRVEGGSVPKGSELVWRVEKYEGGKWIPAEGVRYMVQSTSVGFNIYNNGNNWSPFTGGMPLPNSAASTGEDGLIHLVNSEAEFWPSMYVNLPSGMQQYYTSIALVMFDRQVYVNFYKDMQEGDYRVVEVEKLSDEEWGTLSAYTVGPTTMGNNYYNSYNYYGTFSPWYQKSSVADRKTLNGFVNTKKPAFAKLKIEKFVDEPTETVFNFTIQQYIHPLDDNSLAPGAGLDYTIYDSETDEEIRTGTTTKDGKFSMQGGQYAIVMVPPNSRWRVTEDDPLPYYLDKVVLNDEEIQNGNGADPSLIGDVEEIRKSNMIRNDFANAVMNYATEGPVTKVIFGKTSDYPDVVSDDYIIMDSELQGTIRGYKVVNRGPVYFYVLSDDLMYLNYYSNYMFNNFYNLESVSFSNVDASKALTMSNMFYNCYYLTSVTGTGGWDTGSVRDMSYMFYECYNLPSVDTSGWDTGSVTNMSYMFGYCSNLPSINTSSWDTSNVKDMSYMFAGNSSRTGTSDIAGLNTSAVVDMTGMFGGCNYLTDLSGLSGWNTGNVRSLDYTFGGLNQLTSVEPISGWNTGKVQSMNSTFSSCNNLASIEPLGGWNTGNVTQMEYMFNNCSTLSSIEAVKNWNMNKVTDMDYIFGNCNSLESVDLSGWELSALESVSNMFYYCSALETVDISDWTVPKLYSLSNMFYSCYSLKNVDMSNLTAASLTSVDGLFQNCSSLEEVDLSTLNAPNLSSAAYMFDGCSSLQEADLSTWNTDNLTTISYMFRSCSSLEEVDLSEWTQNKLEYASYLFAGCSNLQTVDLSGWSMSNLYSTNNMFQGCGNLEEADLSNWNVPVLNQVQYMFSNCSKLSSVDMSGWSAGSIYNARNMFSNCSSLESIDLSSWTSTSLYDTQYMFQYCSKLKTADLSNLSGSNVYRADYMFSSCSVLETVDLTKWVGKYSAYATYMFAYDSKLATIYCNNSWTNQYYYYSSSSNNMFSGCEALPNYNANYTNRSRAHSNTGGYFKKKS